MHRSHRCTPIELLANDVDSVRVFGVQVAFDRYVTGIFRLKCGGRWSLQQAEDGKETYHDMLHLHALRRATRSRSTSVWNNTTRGSSAFDYLAHFDARWRSTSRDTANGITLEGAPRQYISLYNYTTIEEEMLPRWKRRFMAAWRQLGVTGRVYIAQEGINAQVTVPVHNVEAFTHTFPSIFSADNLNYGDILYPNNPQSGNDPFGGLWVRVRKQIVADGFEKGHLNLQDSGNALPPHEWHLKLQQRNANAIANADTEKNKTDNSLVLDVRNFYEHEIGRFDGATRIMVDTFRDTFDAVDEILEQHAQQHNGEPPSEVMMYCTGGIRCEKVGAYLKQHKGIQSIHKLKGGIVSYQRFLKEHPEEESLFKGKNFVFDQRCVSGGGTGSLSESGSGVGSLLSAESAEDVTSDVLGKCFQCGAPCNDHTNCRNDMCGGLILQCTACRSQSHGTCSKDCEEELMKMQGMDNSTRRRYRKENAYRWLRGVPNALSRLQAQARGYSTAPPPEGTSELDLNSYVFQVSSSMEDEGLLHELRDATHREWPKAEQLIDEPQGKVLSFLVQLIGAQDVLEVGCFTGYSAICLANGLPRDKGSVTTCDVNAETTNFAQSYFSRSSRREQIFSVVQDGMDYLHTCSSEGRQFDLIFVDANKRQYINYFNAIIEKKLLRKQGLIVLDNTLFRGRVLASANGEAHKKERIAHGLAEFNRKISTDSRVTCVLLPLWDGLTLVRQR